MPTTSCARRMLPYTRDEGPGISTQDADAHRQRRRGRTRRPHPPDQRTVADQGTTRRIVSTAASNSPSTSPTNSKPTSPSTAWPMMICCSPRPCCSPSPDPLAPATGHRAGRPRAHRTERGGKAVSAPHHQRLLRRRLQMRALPRRLRAASGRASRQRQRQPPHHHHRRTHPPLLVPRTHLETRPRHRRHRHPRPHHDFGQRSHSRHAP
jgi:hypothetical protein